MKLLFLIILLFSMLSFYGQKVEQYCEMTAIEKFLSRKVTIDIDNGEERKLFSFKDTRVRDDLGKVKSFNSIVDALNFLGRLGWKLVNAFPVTTGNQNVYHYVFKREFDQSELTEDKSN
ncbi:MAG: hypothetical protein ACHQF0_14340 [Chitinophagales bacterium]